MCEMASFRPISPHLKGVALAPMAQPEARPFGKLTIAQVEVLK